MSGHSKWSTIKRKKGAADAKRGALFTKLAREIQLAAREGADPEYNFKLRLTLDKAKASSMPRDNIDRAVRRGAGLEKGEELTEILYEGYGAAGVAMLVQTLTDNRNRSVSDIRRTFTRAGGNLGESGSVAWQFESKGLIVVPLDDQDQDALFDAAIMAGAEDVQFGEDAAEIYTALTDLQSVRESLEQGGISVDSAELIWQPKMLMTVDARETMQVMSLVEALEDLEDVTKVFTNLDISEEHVTQYMAA